MYFVMLVLDDINYSNDVLNAWDAAGAAGVTIYRSTGLARVKRRAGLQDDMPLMPSLDQFFEGDESQHRTLITIADNHDLVKRIVDATQAIVGDLNEPNTGILVVLPVLEAYGLHRKNK